MAGDVFTPEFVPCFYFKLRSVTTAKKRNICPPKRRLIFYSTQHDRPSELKKIYINSCEDETSVRVA